MNPRSNDNNNLEIIMDDFLKSYVTKYDRWRQEGSFSFSSKIIPVNESISASQWILPSDQVLQILKDAESFALTDCICRTHYSRCENPREVCLLLNKRSDQAVEHNTARRISLADASEVLKEADKQAWSCPLNIIYAGSLDLRDLQLLPLLLS